jgi:ubiquinone/menaquinone biosynthesis C-methylase UbiE
MAAAYDDYDYPKYWNGREYEHGSEVIAIDSFFKKIGVGKKIIDIGAGYGRLAKEYDKYAKEITLAEPSKSLIRKAKEYLLNNKSEIKFVKSTIQNLPNKVKGKKYDVVVLVRVMHHIDNTGEAIKIASSLLPKGGYFILEFANKLHGKAILRNFLSGNFTFPLDIFPVDRRSKKNVKEKSISFVNHHPDVIKDLLKDSGFRVLEKRSVSNIRSRRIKRVVPVPILLRLATMLQLPLARVNFGPSIFILAKKK